MATPETTRPEFGPEAAARRAHAAERAERMKAATRDALDFDKPAPRFRTAVDVGIDDAVATTAERAALRTARTPRAIQEAQRALAAKKAALRSQQPAGQPQRAQRPRLRDRLEAMTEVERRAAVESVTPGTRERDYIERLVEVIRDEEQQAEYLNAVVSEEQALANIAALDDEPFDWEHPDAEPVADAAPAWSAMTPAEMRAAEAEAAAAHPWEAAKAAVQAAAIAGPLYAGDPAELEDEYEYEYEEGDE